jgi:hypothetical protein
MAKLDGFRAQTIGEFGQTVAHDELTDHHRGIDRGVSMSP